MLRVSDFGRRTVITKSPFALGPAHGKGAYHSAPEDTTVKSQ